MSLGRLAPRIRIELVGEPEAQYQQKPLRSPADVWKLATEEVGHCDRERFLVLALDGRHRPLGVEEVSVGTATASLVHPREVFKSLLLVNAVSFVLIHNHPSGDPSPSCEDRSVTHRLGEAAKVLGLDLVDHVIVGSQGFYSFKEEGAL